MQKPNLNLLVAIREKGLRQRDFCKLVGDDDAIVSRAINGSFNLDESRKIKYAKALGKRPEELFKD